MPMVHRVWPAQQPVRRVRPFELLRSGPVDGGTSMAASDRRHRLARVALPPVSIAPRPTPDAPIPIDDGKQSAVSVVHRVRLQPGVVEMQEAWPELGRAMSGKMLSLDLVTPHMLDRIPDDRVWDFLDQLGRTRQKAHWRLKHVSGGRRHLLLHRSRSATVSGVSALTLLMAANNEHATTTRLLLARPVEVALDLADAVPALFTLDNMALIFGDLIPSITSPDIEWDQPEDEQINALGSMVHAFLTTHAQEKPALVEGWVVALMQRLERSGFETTSANLGLLAGVVLAGAYKYAKAIRTFDEKRYYVIDKTALVAFATSAFVPFSPVTGAVSVIAVFSGILLEKYFPVRDLNKFVTQLEGRLRVRLLKLQIFSSPLELPLLMNWLVGALRCNDLT